jgi:hypothetical protein
MKTITILALILISSVLSLGQNGSNVAQTIEGKVINAETNEAISYTNIGIEGTFYGTASNEEGDFKLKIPEEMVDKNIFFSAVGFKGRRFPVKQLFGNDFNTIKLQPQSYDVDKVDIEAQNLVLIRILRMASENIRYNNGAGPFNLHCSYTRKTTTKDTSYITSADVLIYDKTGYSQPSVLDAYRSRNYRVSNAGEAYSFSSNMLKLDELLALDWVRSASEVLNPALLRDYQLRLKDQPSIDGEEYWVIAFKQILPTLEGSGDFYATAFEGTITISKDNYSVQNISVKIKSPKNNRQDRSLAIADGNINYLEDLTYTFSVDYKDLLLHNISLSKNYTYHTKTYSEETELQVIRAHANNLTVLDSREYFPTE